MSLLDDDNEIEYSCAIVNARKYVEELYAEADKKRAETVDYLWELQAKKIGVPQGATSTEAWDLFRDAITFETQDKAVEMFDLTPSYKKTMVKVQYLENHAKNLQSDLNDTIKMHSESLQKNIAMAKELLRVVKCNPDADYDPKVVASALEIVYGRDWTFNIDGRFETRGVPAIIQRCEERRQKFSREIGHIPQEIMWEH